MSKIRTSARGSKRKTSAGRRGVAPPARVPISDERPPAANENVDAFLEPDDADTNPRRDQSPREPDVSVDCAITAGSA